MSIRNLFFDNPKTVNAVDNIKKGDTFCIPNAGVGLLPCVFDGTIDCFGYYGFIVLHLEQAFSITISKELLYKGYYITHINYGAFKKC